MLCREPRACMLVPTVLSILLSRRLFRASQYQLYAYLLAHTSTHLVVATMTNQEIKAVLDVNLRALSSTNNAYP